MQLYIIAAVADNNAIGKDNNLLCHLSGDLQNFKKLTMGCPIIMGRKTFESFPKGALPGRRNIVLSKSVDSFPGCETYKTVEQALESVKNVEKCFVIGGQQIYRQFFDMADKLYITRIRKSFDDADAFFPEIDIDYWRINSISDELSADEKNDHPFFFAVYERMKRAPKNII